jgi:methionine synthase I (cobalamin-dependent)
MAILDIRKSRNIEIPLMISGTVTDASGRTLSGANCRGIPGLALTF